MKFTIVAKLTFSFLLFYSSIVSSRLKKLSRDRLLIIMYHRILPGHEAERAVQAGMYVKPEIFRLHLEFLKKRFYLVPISALGSVKTKAPDAPNGKPCCVLTFDDGWHDFYQYAFPNLKECRVPATVFLPTDFIGTKRWFWTDLLAYFLLQKKKASVKSNSFSVSKIVKELEQLRGSFESCLETGIEMLKAFRIDEIEEILSELLERRNESPTPDM